MRLMCLKKNIKQEVPKKQSDCAVNTVAILVIIITLSLLGLCAYVFVHTCIIHTSHIESDQIWMQTRDSIYADADYIDSIFLTGISEREKALISANKNKKMTVDSLKATYVVTLKDIEKIMNSQKALIVRQDKLADDLRQESNNLINKVNGWLGFWMGVMAILGVFVPIALQFKLYREARDIDLQMKEEHKEDRKDIKNQIKKNQRYINIIQNKMKRTLESVENDSQSRMNAFITQAKSEINQEITEEISKMSSVRLTMMAKHFQNIIECPEIKINENRNLLLSKNWENIIQIFGNIVKDFKFDSSDGCDKFDMSVALIQISSILSSIRSMSTHRTRRIKQLIDSANSMIQKLNDIGSDNTSVQTDLNNFYSDLNNFHPLPI